ncbi:copper amine oxidase N-terminal domain-containing protein [Paenibacillus sp. 2TAB26]|uniref:copper amine oxidase N-terminal domain-containing protein n=1 Tax=Paenibacillus sp. 2TAB26 TaxID=3233005 RepID=UPI003F96EE7E
MIKKLTFTLFAIAMLILPALPTLGSAANQVATVANGKLLNNRVLVPLRAISENLGTPVEWHQGEKTVVINKRDSVILIPTNFKRAVIITPSLDPSISKDIKYIDYDAPAQIIQDTTYVPLRFVSELLGASLTWNKQSKEATITLDGKQTVVKMEHPSFEPTHKLSNERLKLLSEKLNEATDVSKANNIKTDFKPYFTNTLINSIVKNKGLDKEHKQDTPITSVYYTSKTTASLTQSIIFGNGLTAEDHYVSDRTSYFVYTGGVWKVDSVKFTFRTIIQLGL